MNLISPLVLIAVVLAFLAQSIGFAEKMDIATNTVVIEKLKGVLESISPSNPTRGDLELRLADLYSERSRLYAMDEVAKNCEKCKESHNDREQALALYQTVLKNADKETRGVVILQMTQLYELQGQSPKAIEIYKNVLAHPKDYSAEMLGRSYTGLGEAEFRKIKYADAQRFFEKAMAIPETPNKAHITYRLSWCYFHKGEFKKASETLTQVLQKADVDNTFKEEGSRDLATFISRGTVTTNEIQTLAQLSPENVRKDNLVYLAHELDRLGKKSASVLVWNIVGQGEKSPQDQMESELRLAELQFDAGKLDQTLLHFQATLDLWKKNGCTNKDECAVLNNRLRKLVLDWNHSEEETPNALILSAYTSYLSVFSDDMEMNYRAALVARSLSKWTESVAFYRKASQLSTSKDKNFEASLLGEIEVAEISKNAQMTSEAYAHYLAANPNGAKAFEVRYQQAHLLYDNNEVAKAAPLFRDLALTKNGDKNLREKSADLALDSLVLTKQNDLAVTWANEFAQAFPDRKGDFLKIASHVTMNQGAQTINDATASPAQLKTALEKLKQVNLSTANKSERIANIKNRLIIAERLRDLPEVMKAANELLVLKGISAEDRELALSRKAWVAEMTLDFKTAFEITKNLKMTGLSKKDRLLKLAMLAELAGQNATAYYQQYISVSGASPESVAIAAKLVRASKNPEKLFNQYQRLLSSNPELYSGLAIEIFAKNRSLTFARHMLKEKTLQKTTAAEVFSRFLYLKDFSALERSVSQLKVDVRSEAKLEKSLKHLLKQLGRMEEATQYAVRSGDWVLQITTLDALAKQDRRVAAEIITLSVPRGLSAGQSAMYRKVLAQRASEFQNKSQALGGKVMELWNKEAMTSSLLDEYKKSKGDVRKLLSEELKIIARVAPRGQRSVLVQALATHNVIVQARINLFQAEAAVKADPFDRGRLENLKQLAEKDQKDTMVAYLDARLLKLNSGVAR